MRGKTRAMSFSGKKFRRVRCENVEELMKAANSDEEGIRLLQSSAPVFSFTRLDETRFQFELQTGSRVMSQSFTLGVEHEMERRNGNKVLVTYSLEGDDVLHQVIKQPDGRILHFIRKFGENDAKMTITVDGIDRTAYVYYEAVNS